MSEKTDLRSPAFWQHSGLRVAFVPDHSGGSAPEFHGIPFLSSFEHLTQITVATPPWSVNLVFRYPLSSIVATGNALPPERLLITAMIETLPWWLQPVLLPTLRRVAEPD
jgi:hypothetical protein